MSPFSDQGEKKEKERERGLKSIKLEMKKEKLQPTPIKWTA